MALDCNPDKPVLCEMCQYSGALKTYRPCEGYNDIRCPKCGSTKNAHNREYMKRLCARLKDGAR